MPYQVLIHDLFEMSERPYTGAIFEAEGIASAGSPSFGSIIEPAEFSTAYPTSIRLGDSLLLDGASWRITGLEEGNAYTHSGGIFSPQSGMTSVAVIIVSDGSTERVFAVEYDLYVAPILNSDGSPAPTTEISFWAYSKINSINVANIRQDNTNHLYVPPPASGSVCFATGTMIETSNGPRPVERLRVGELIRTRDNGFQPLRWLGGRRLTGFDLDRAPTLRPIRISAGALGQATPAQDLTVSPQHRMLVRSTIAQRMTGEAEVLVAAVHLLDMPGVERVSAPNGVGYWHLMFDAHEIVFANGAEAESLYLGPNALKALDENALAELGALFPELVHEGDTRDLARSVLGGKQTRKLVERQVKNGKPLVAPLVLA